MTVLNEVSSSAFLTDSGKKKLVFPNVVNGQVATDAITPVPFKGALFNKLLTDLEGDAFARLLLHMEYVALPAGHEVQACGDRLDFVLFPETAVLSHVFFLEDGSSTGAAIVGNDGVVGLSAILGVNHMPRWVHVVIGGSAIRIRLSVVKEEFARAGAFQRIMFTYTTARMAQLSQRAVCNGRHTLNQRLYTWLLMVQDRTTEECLPLTHEQIAMQLGARRAGVTNACNTLKDGQIIGYRRGLIRILNRPMLEAAACECYSVLRLSRSSATVSI